jgi:3-oxoacyl-[acyl-carrier-protein] synthase-1
MSANPVAITGLGAVTPVGLSLPSTCAALRAGVSRMVALEGWNDHGPPPPEDLVAGRVPMEWMRGDVRTEWPGHERFDLVPPKPHRLLAPDTERLAELAVLAAEEAWQDAGRPRGRVGLYLGLPEDDDGRAVAGAVSRALTLEFELQRGDRLGRAAALAAVHRALRHLRDGRVDVALVGGVDSLLRRAALARMSAAGMLRSDVNPTGVIPGEAAVFMVLQAEGALRKPRAWIVASAVAEEPTAGTDEPNQGVGLTKALRLARQGGPGYSVRPLVVCDLNGERYRTIEWSFANVRALGDVHPAEGTPTNALLWHPADCIGDSGAASGALNVAWASVAMRKGYAGAKHAITWGASDGPLRASVLLSRDQED